MTTYTGTTSNETLTGGTGDDTLVGDTGSDTLAGGAGNDTIYGDLGIVSGTGTFSLASTATNDSLASAMVIDDNWSLDYDPNICSSTTLPHVAISAVGTDAFQYFAVTLQAGTVLTLDIDGTEDNPLDANLSIFDSNGNLLAFADDVPDDGDFDPGSDNYTEPLLTVTIPTSGIYYILVGDYTNTPGVPGPIAADEYYTLNVTIAGEQTVAGGNDSITGGAGDDTIIGGTGSDVAVYSGDSTDYSFTGTASVFTITDSVDGRDGVDTVTSVEFLQFADGTFAVSDFVPVCFLAGTMIRTPEGETAVDRLAIGDLVTTADGRALPVRFIGRQTIVTRFADALANQPVCIAAGALEAGVPARDLYTSPGHAMVIGGMLVVASALVNGTTIRRMERMPERFTYFHIELAEHAVIFAEGAATETFCDNVPRAIFDNAAEHRALYPQAAPIPQLDLPTVKSARQLPLQLRLALIAHANRAATKGSAPVPSRTAA